MADIKIDLSTGHQVANPFKTVRKSSTNPFKYSNFEGESSFKGNTLQFADVFAGYKPADKASKLRMIASSVAGSMTKIRSSIAEPIVNFVKRVSGDISGAWEYAKNLNVTKFGSYKPLVNLMNTDVVELGKGLKNSVKEKISGLHIEHGISDYIANVTDLGKSIGSKWTEVIDGIKIRQSKHLKNVPVAELREMWVAINAEAKEAHNTLKEVA